MSIIDYLSLTSSGASSEHFRVMVQSWGWSDIPVLLKECEKLGKPSHLLKLIGWRANALSEMETDGITHVMLKTLQSLFKLEYSTEDRKSDREYKLKISSLKN